jgi:hypothetical protein
MIYEISNIVNFLTTETVETLFMGDHYVSSVDNDYHARGNSSFESIVNCYTKWKNTDKYLEHGMKSSSQLSLPLNLKN